MRQWVFGHGASLQINTHTPRGFALGPPSSTRATKADKKTKTKKKGSHFTRVKNYHTDNDTFHWPGTFSVCFGIITQFLFPAFFTHENFRFTLSKHAYSSMPRALPASATLKNNSIISSREYTTPSCNSHSRPRHTYN